MKHVCMLLAGAGLIIASGAIASARADGDKTADSDKKSVTLFTPQGRGDALFCDAVNVSGKTLGMAFAIFGDDGMALCPTCNSAGTGNPTSEAPISPGKVGEIAIQLPIGAIQNGYCEVAVFGTRNRDDVRVNLRTSGTRMIPGTTIPVFLFRDVEGH
jgi:hypothetical protein